MRSGFLVSGGQSRPDPQSERMAALRAGEPGTVGSSLCFQSFLLTLSLYFTFKLPGRESD